MCGKRQARGFAASGHGRAARRVGATLSELVGGWNVVAAYDATARTNGPSRIRAFVERHWFDELIATASIFGADAWLRSCALAMWA
ncbi:hypothetical protein ACVWZN_002916 [Lysobacter sp. HA35]